jgi:hypothetical protein
MPNLPDCAPGSCNKEGSPPGCRAKGAGSKGSPGPSRRTVPSGGVADSLDEAKGDLPGGVERARKGHRGETARALMTLALRM